MQSNALKSPAMLKKSFREEIAKGLHHALLQLFNDQVVYKNDLQILGVLCLTVDHEDQEIVIKVNNTLRKRSGSISSHGTGIDSRGLKRSARDSSEVILQDDDDVLDQEPPIKQKHNPKQRILPLSEIKAYDSTRRQPEPNAVARAVMAKMNFREIRPKAADRIAIVHLADKDEPHSQYMQDSYVNEFYGGTYDVCPDSATNDNNPSEDDKPDERSDDGSFQIKDEPEEDDAYGENPVSSPVSHHESMDKDMSNGFNEENGADEIRNAVKENKGLQIMNITGGLDPPSLVNGEDNQKEPINTYQYLGQELLLKKKEREEIDSLILETPSGEPKRSRRQVPSDEELIMEAASQNQDAEVAKTSEYTCKYCFLIFTNLVQYTQHTMTEHRAYLCHHCGKSFTTKSSLFRHRAVHTGLRRFMCALCGKSFYRKDKCRAHISCKHKIDNMSVVQHMQKPPE